MQFRQTCEKLFKNIKPNLFRSKSEKFEKKYFLSKTDSFFSQFFYGHVEFKFGNQTENFRQKPEKLLLNVLKWEEKHLFRSKKFFAQNVPMHTWNEVSTTPLKSFQQNAEHIFSVSDNWGKFFFFLTKWQILVRMFLWRRKLQSRQPRQKFSDKKLKSYSPISEDDKKLSFSFKTSFFPQLDSLDTYISVLIRLTLIFQQKSKNVLLHVLIL